MHQYTLTYNTGQVGYCPIHAVRRWASVRWATVRTPGRIYVIAELTIVLDRVQC